LCRVTIRLGYLADGDTPDLARASEIRCVYSDKLQDVSYSDRALLYMAAYQRPAPADNMRDGRDNEPEA
jgi:hypothetical protein